MDFGRFHVTRAAIPGTTILTFRRKRELLPEFATVVPGRIIVAKITRKDVGAEKPTHRFTVKSYEAGEKPRVLFAGDSWVCMSKTEKMVYRMVKCNIKETQRRRISRKRKAAAKRLGVDVEKPVKNDLLGMSGFNRDIVAGDFGSMMDDQNGEPAIKRILAKKDTLSDKDRKAAEYYENYRYTWLEVQAVKAGVGLKCRDLLTGEDLFLMEMSASQSPNVKGMTFCAGIAPMGSVYLTLGVLHPANFENPATILKIVLTHLGLPTELPIRLSFADQARFAAETIRRLDANGKFGSIHY